jgi:hypothetical protein
MVIKKGSLYSGYGLIVLAEEQTSETTFSGTVFEDHEIYSKGDYLTTWQISVFEEVVENKTTFTKEEIEREVEERVRFKMNELLTGLKNRSAFNWNNAFNSGNPKYQHYMEAQNEMVEMFNKELEMKFPYEFNEKKDKENRIRMDKVIQNVIDRFKLRGRFSGHELNSVLYNILKELQK